MPKHAFKTPLAALAGLLVLAQAADAVDHLLSQRLARELNSGLSWSRGDYGCADCNVVLISIDTLRQDHVGAYGYERDTTPNVDAFAADSIRFANAVSQAPSTLPSHASIFTSMIPEHHRAFHSKSTPLPDEATTMAEVLFDAGFRTAAYTAGAQMRPAYNLAQGFDIYEAYTEELTHQSRFSDIVDQASGFLDEHGDEQFFLFLHTYEVHSPYTPPPEYLHEFDPDYDGDLGDEIDVPYLRAVFQNPVRLRISDADRRHIVAAYDGEIRNMDDAFGRLIDDLRHRGLYDRTIIVFTSDHGEEFGERGRVGWHSWTLYDELLRVPLLMKLGDSRHAGRVVGEVARGIDILPTLVDVLGIDERFPFEGTTLMDRALNRRTDVVFSVGQRDLEGTLPTSIRTARWKFYDGALYDLALDPMERIDVSAARPLIRASLDTSLALLLSRRALAEAARLELDEAAIRELRNLGYIQ